MGGGDTASQAGEVRAGGDGSPGKAQTRALPAPFLSLPPQPEALLSLQGDVPDTQRSAKDVPELPVRLRGPALHGTAQHTGQDTLPATRLSPPGAEDASPELGRLAGTERESSVRYTPLGRLTPTTTGQRK